MFPTLDDTVYIYARACRSWYKDGASLVARDKIAEMNRRGDQSGAEFWKRLEAEIERTPIPLPGVHG